VAGRGVSRSRSERSRGSTHQSPAEERCLVGGELSVRQSHNRYAKSVQGEGISFDLAFPLAVVHLELTQRLCCALLSSHPLLASPYTFIVVLISPCPPIGFYPTLACRPNLAHDRYVCEGCVPESTDICSLSFLYPVLSHELFQVARLNIRFVRTTFERFHLPDDATGLR
jgi:hypothetical protein